MIARRTLVGILCALTCLSTLARGADEEGKTEREPLFEIGEIEVPEGDVVDVIFASAERDGYLLRC